MAEKKYYWVKLKDVFFDDKRIKILRRSKEGYRFICIYLMMQLKAIKTDGMFEYSGVLTDFVDEVSVIIGEPKKIVKKALEIFEKLELLEILENSNMFLSEVPEIVEYGGEQASAERVRKCREKQKALQCNSEVTAEKQKSNTEIETEIEKEIEKESDSLDQPDSLSLSGPVAYPKSVEEVMEYCKAEGLYTDAERFFGVYHPDWLDKNGAPIRDWKKLCAGPVWNVKPTEPVQKQPKQKTHEPDPEQRRKAVLENLVKEYFKNGIPIPPVDLEEVKKHCTQFKGINPDEFFNYFEGTGWMLYDKPVLDWKSTAYLWDRAIRNSSKKLTPTEIADIIYKGPGNFTIWDEKEAWFNYVSGLIKIDHILKDAGKMSSFGAPCPVGMTMEEYEEHYRKMTE